MKTSKYAIIFVSCVALVAVGVMMFYSGEESKEDGSNQVLHHEENIEAEPIEEFVLTLEDEMVVMYRISDGDKNEIYSVKIDEEYYPPEDIKELKEGIVAYTIEEGYEIMENFVN
ncbi:MAG: hypothetical protein E7417_05170 [Ruminococcaceae bacterium]|nr:hypothetical protein [Oscillospiraceae bacterium]